MVITAQEVVYRVLLLIKRVLGLSCLLGILVACSGGNEDAQNKASVNHMERAARYESQGQYRAAAIEYRNAIQKSTNKDEARLGLASLFNHLGQTRSALGLLGEIEDKSSAEYQFALIESYVLRRKYKSARNALERFDHLASSSQQRYDLLSAQVYSGLGETKEALKLYQKWVDADPSNEDAAVGLAKTLLRSGNITRAQTTILEAKTHLPTSVDLLILEARILSNIGDLDGAEVPLNEALAALPSTDVMSPKKVRVLSMLADLLARQGRSTEAYVYSKLLAEAFPNASEIKGQFEAAFTAFKEGNWDVAEQQLNGILEDAPTHEAAGSLLAVVKYMQGDVSGADQLFQDYVDSETVDGSVKRVYALTNMRMNRPQEVMALFQDELEKGDNPTSLGLYGIAALSSDNTASGVAALEKSLELDPSQSKFRQLLADHFNAISAKDRALKVLQEGVVFKPYDPHLDLAYVRQLLMVKQYKKAEDFIKKRIAEQGSDSDYLLLAGEFYLARKQHQKAKNYFTSILKRDETNIQAYRGLIRVDAAANDWSRVLKHLDNILAFNQSSEFAYRGIIVSHERLGNIQAGVDRVAELAALDPSNPIPRGILAQYYLSERQLELAEKQWQQIADDSEKGSNVKQNLGISIQLIKARQAFNQGNYEQARKLFLSVLQVQPRNYSALSFLVSTEIRTGRYKEATKFIGQIPPDKALLPLINELKADLDLAYNKLPEALNHYMKAWSARPVDSLGLKIYRLIKRIKQEDVQSFVQEDWLKKLPKSVPARLVLAEKFQGDNQFKAASGLYEQVVEMSPQSVVALNNLAWVYQQMGDKRAIPTAKQAYELAPESPEVMDTYGWILVQNQQYQQGKPLLDKALELSPDNKEIQSHVEEADKLMSEGV